MKINVRRLKKFFFHIHSFMVSDLSFSLLFIIWRPSLFFLCFSQFCFLCASPTFVFVCVSPTFHFQFFTSQFCLLCVSPTFAFLLFVSHFCSFGVSPVLPFICLSHVFYVFFSLFFAFCVSLPLLLSSLILPHPCGSLPGKFHLRGYYQRSRKMRKNVCIFDFHKYNNTAIDRFSTTTSPKHKTWHSEHKGAAICMGWKNT